MALPDNVNLAAKFSPKLDQAFKLNSYTDSYVNQNFDFDGVNQIKVYTLDTTDLVDYNMATNSDRYGGFSEITDSLQTFTLANDKAFKKSLDNANEDDSAKAKSAAEWLALEMNEVLVPEIDKDRFSTASTASTAPGGGGAYLYSSSTLLADIRAMNARCDEVSAPINGRVCFVTPGVLNDLKAALSTSLSQTDDAIIRTRGLAGNIDGIPIIQVPTALFPTNVKALFWHKQGLLSARKLTETKIYTNSEFVSGTVIKGRFRYDSFALSGDGKKIACFQKLMSQLNDISITTQPADDTATAGSITDSDKATVVSAITGEGSTMSYQWYSNTESSNIGGTAITGETEASFEYPTTLTAGTYYYYCVVSGTDATPLATNCITVVVS